MIVVADAGPVIHLAAAGVLDLLPSLFGRVLVPREVYDEVVQHGAGRAGSAELAVAAWIEVRDSGGDSAVQSLLLQELDRGEAAAIALAVAVGAELLLIDERAGRQAALRLGLECGGSPRVILEAKRRGLVESVADIVERMRRGGVWLSPMLVRAVRAEAGEGTLGPETGEDD